MSLKPQKLDPIPSETIRVCKAAFPKNSLCMRIRDELGVVFEDEQFASLFPKRGQPSLAPWRLALITILQFLENLSDRQAAQMVRSRLDWKYLLALELTDQGFDFSVLSEFRTRLIAGQLEHSLLDNLLKHLKTLGLVKAGGKQGSDSTHLLAAVRQLSRLEFMAETLRAALNAVAALASEWLNTHFEVVTLKRWIERYGVRVEEYRLPEKEAERQEYACLVGQDGYQLLQALYFSTEGSRLRDLEAVQLLRKVWLQHYYREDDQVGWREKAELAPTNKALSSPYDPEARYGNKGSKQWLGYKVHLSESCDEQPPRLITNVETTPAPVLDVKMLETIHENLAAKALLPAQHLVDAGYPDAELLVKSYQDYQIELIAPVGISASWQNQTNEAYRIEHFKIDWEGQKVACRQGHQSKTWNKAFDSNENEMIGVRFEARICRDCSVRKRCTRSKTGSRTLSFRPKTQHEALQSARTRQSSQEFKEIYRLRAGVEGSFSQGVRVCGMRKCRYKNLAKTHLPQLASAVALNLAPVLSWMEGTPLAPTRKSSLARLALAC